MRVASRLRDATRSPQRLWWFGVRVVKLLLRGEFATLLSRLRATAPDAAAYRAWLETLRVQAPAPLGAAPWREVRVDVVDAEERRRIGERLARTASAAGRGEAFVLLAGADVVPDAGLASCLANALASCPDAEAAYTDFDHFDESGRRERPFLASAWDGEQAFECNPCGPLIALRDGVALAASEAAPRGEAISAAIAELAATPGARVVHVPGVLYHVRRSVSFDATRHGRRGTLAAQRRGARAVFDPNRSPAVSFEVPPGTKVSIVVPVRDQAELLRRCLASVPATVGAAALEVVVVDNGSTQGEVQAVCNALARTRELTVVARPVPFNFAALCNAGAAQAHGDVLLFLNNDARFTDERDVTELVGLAVRQWTGAVGPWLVYEDGRVQSAGVFVGVNRTATSALAGFAPDDPAAVAWGASRRRVSAVMGACLAVERRKFLAVNGFDERFAVSHNEVDLCLRLEQAGFANVVSPYARVVHIEGATRGFEVEPAERTRLAREEQLFRERWAARIAGTDPAHHPWRARTGNPFQFARAPVHSAPRMGWEVARG